MDDKELHNKHWLGEYLGPSGAVRESWRRLRRARRSGDEQKLIDQLSATSSTYHSAARGIYAEVLLKPWKILLLPIALWLDYRSEELSDEMVGVAGGLEHLRVEELDVRASIKYFRERNDEAERCIRLALAFDSCPVSTRALLLCTQSRILNEEGKFGRMEEVLHRALALASRLPPKVAVRIWRAGYELLGDEECFRKAEELAIRHNLPDQLRKLQASRRWRRVRR